MKFRFHGYARFALFLVVFVFWWLVELPYWFKVDLLH